MRVFIADDSTIVAERLADLLRDVPGVELVGRAGDVLEAVRSIQKLSPDAVILDIEMPGGTGLDVLRAVRPDHPASKSSSAQTSLTLNIARKASTRVQISFSTNPRNSKRSLQFSVH